MATMMSSEDIEDSLSVSDITVQNAAPENRYTEEFDDVDSDELDNSQVIIVVTCLAREDNIISLCKHSSFCHQCMQTMTLMPARK